MYIPKKDRKPRVKKVKLTKVGKKVNLIKTKIGKLEGAIGIIQGYQGRFVLILRVDQKGLKRPKIIRLFSGPKVEFLQEIGSQLSTELNFPYNPNISEEKKRGKKVKEEGANVDHSLFKEYNGQYFIFLNFGTIWLNEEIHCLRNYDKLEGCSNRIFEMIATNKFPAAYHKCKEKLMNYSDEIKDQILKEVSHYGCFEDKNTVRVVMGLKPIELQLGDDL